MIAKPSADPTPRPPLTTTFASRSETPPALSSTRSSTRDERCRRRRCERSRPARLRPAGCVCGATVRIRGEPCSRASSSRLPPQRTRVTTSPSIAVTFAANGWSSRAATCASSSLPRSEPAATIVSAPCRGLDERGRPRGRRVRAVDRDRAHVAERAREPERLQRQVVVRLDEDEDAHATPSACITSTTRGAAAAPSPRISACLPWPSGSDEPELLELRRRAAPARRLRAASTSPAAGPAPTGSAAGSVPRARSGRREAALRRRRARRLTSRSQRTRPSPTSIFFSPVTTGRPSAYATRIPTW